LVIGTSEDSFACELHTLSKMRLVADTDSAVVTISNHAICSSAAIAALIN
jgi:hypothetical protein